MMKKGKIIMRYKKKGVKERSKLQVRIDARTANRNKPAHTIHISGKINDGKTRLRIIQATSHRHILSKSIFQEIFARGEDG